MAEEFTNFGKECRSLDIASEVGVKKSISIRSDIKFEDLESESSSSESLNDLSQETVDEPLRVLKLTSDGEEPTAEEKAELRHIAENLSLSAWLVAIVELCERFAYYGCQGLFQNYIQRPYNGREGPGALGLGQHGANNLNMFFQFWCFVTPIIGAIIADQYLGKYKTIAFFCVIYIAGLIVLFVISLPFSLEAGAGLGGFIAAIILIGLGTGGIKTTVCPLIAEQYQRKRMAIKTLKSGERVILDPALTIQRIYMVFTMCVNIGSLSVLGTPYMEFKLAWSFSSAYLLCLCMFLLGFVVLILGRKIYIVQPPQGHIITDAFKAIWIMIRNRDTNAPKQSWQEKTGKTKVLPWDDHFIEELKRTLVACKVFTVFPIFWVVYHQFSTNFVSQAGQMNTHGVPNDIMQNFDPIAIILFIPLFDQVIYPMLQKSRISFPPINRISLGFLVASVGMAYAAVVQYMIYQTGPCYAHPQCADAPIADGIAQGNNVHIAIQAPAYILIGIAEILASVTGQEYAFMKAPPSMRSFVQALYLLTYAFGAAISEALSPIAGDSTVLWMYVGISIAAFVTGCGFWLLFRGLNAKEDEMNTLRKEDTNPKDEKEAVVV